MSARDEQPSYIAFAAANVRQKAPTSATIVRELLDRIERDGAALKASQPRTITTTAELDALPEGAAVLDADRVVSTKHNGMWHGYEMNPLDSRKFAKCGPFTVLYEPSA